MSHKEVIAAGLRRKRAELKLPQKEVARAVGASQVAVSSWENTGGMTVDFLWRLADFYGCGIDELIGRETPSPLNDRVIPMAGGRHA